jgi:hypothetical protein
VSLSARLLRTLSLASTGPPVTGVEASEGKAGGGWPNSVEAVVALVPWVSRELLCE